MWLWAEGARGDDITNDEFMYGHDISVFNVRVR